MSNPFKKIADTAKETQKKWESTKEEPAVTTITCPKCGSPRPVGTNIAICAYCGHKFMEVKVEIKHRRP
ncbi:hypothetical protein MKQ70_11310 [Chitinophaga sedimenti]|uniref:hypothetical protein n=1 Tax=Chitinophaga sedimenti TaxID=2033606 RepID=UPI002004AD52|nr:hypothetical protein [Chitinophaga sedimenti]MCK7555565.1 hypothetical protein [Chitinophaga sedimenti]